MEGTAIGSDAASGRVRVIHDLRDISQMQEGDILVADMTDPDCKFQLEIGRRFACSIRNVSQPCASLLVDRGTGHSNGFGRRWIGLHSRRPHS